MKSLTETLSERVTLQEREELRKVISFVKEYFPQYEESDIENVLWMHRFYGTLDVVYREDQIVACVRWNISQDGKVCDVLDLVVKKGENGFRIMKHLIARNWHRFPSVRYIRFFRQFKYKDRGVRMYPIKKILQLRSSL